MKSYKLFHQLLDLAEQLEDRHQGREITLTDFTGFLLNHTTNTAMNDACPDERFGKNDPDAQALAYQLDNNIGRLFIYMSRYAKSYIKKTLEGTALTSAEDFTALSILLTHDHLSKSELISRNLQEKTSGTEVIKRLISSGLVTQWNNDADKRGKRIAITASGRALLYEVFQDMNHVGKMITGDLSAEEKFTLQYLLQKLETFHHTHFEHKTITSKADLKAYTRVQSGSVHQDTA